ncbi:helix-turn-helix domain-containing protein [Clostridium felsineum]|uniref:helix-turn-helix domain-containing protein n=1 Tax=Clostridium felsineum TaxID=36839 RepID=UPI00098C2CCE|nr:helix-turn-helix transcriptional regulator [Clostridium felsineum]URZ16883.1 hypothetical protein CLFE_029300 [Clostridium felsineum DSM 794]
MVRNGSETIMYERVNTQVQGVIETEKEVRLVSKLDQLIKERGLTQNKLSLITGIKPSIITRLAHGRTTSINKAHVLSIMIALRITDIRELFDIEFTEETKIQYEKERTEWIETKKLPLSIKAIFAKLAGSRLD